MLYYLRQPRLNPETLKWGALLGTANFGNYLFLVMALTALPGLVVYPVIAAGEVGLMAVAGVVLWKEKVGVRSWLGIALAVIAIVLIQLGKAGGA
jgi:multidrug transporter EmrE-like cation transporter